MFTYGTNHHTNLSPVQSPTFLYRSVTKCQRRRLILELQLVYLNENENEGSTLSSFVLRNKDLKNVSHFKLYTS